MSAAVFSIVLFAALCHAVWNAIVKRADDKTLTAVLVAATAAVVAAIALPFLPQPAAASWRYLAVSVVLQTGYYFLVAAAYRAADMSQAYPLMRGTAPLIVAAVTALWLGEHLAPAAWLGVALISAGVVGVSLAAWSGGNGRGIGLALGNAVVIAAYTITDGWGVRLSGSPAGYTMWLFLLTAIPLAGWEIWARPAEFRRYAAANLPIAAVGGAGTLVSYGLALWAMTVAPVAVVAALRETSIVFAVAIAALGLGEKVTPPRLAAIAVIAAGAIALRLA